jgi:hypothetical protein
MGLLSLFAMHYAAAPSVEAGEVYTETTQLAYTYEVPWLKRVHQGRMEHYGATNKFQAPWGLSYLYYVTIEMKPNLQKDQCGQVYFR